MSYSLNLDPDKPYASQESRGSHSNSGGRRRFSLSTLGDLHRSPASTLPRAGSLTGNEMVDDANGVEGAAVSSQANQSPSYSLSRVERLLRERQIRRSTSWYQLGESEPGTPSEGKASEPLSADAKSSSYETLSSADAHPASSQPIRLIVVANRLPVSTVLKPDGSWSLELSAGGLVSALLGVKQNFETCWIGWPGVYLKSETEQKKLTDALKQKGCVPVFLDEKTVDQYYNGYCNNILWPLFHYLGLPQEYKLDVTRSVESQYSAYKRANELFADVVMSQYNDGDVVWCHDYHLMLLPAFLKERKPQMRVGWFLHTPFPSSEIYRTLPLRAEILKSSLAADLVGFHTYDYARHYVSACTRVLGFEGTPDGVENHGKLTRVSAFPIGIDPDRFVKALETSVVKSHITDLLARFGGRKVMLGVDRLDMIKGIPQKLLAFEKFLEENPKWRDKVVLVQIAVPSRTDVPEYQRLRSNVHEIVGRINGKFGTLTTVPIHHLDRTLNFHELCALYAITDVALVTSLRDGMNLVSYEFVACQSQKKGVLILSEFAGAAQSLGAGAILVNPWNISEMENAIGDALNMPEEERTERHRHNFMHVMNHTAQAWADTFVSELNDTVYEAEIRTRRVPPLLPTSDFAQKFFASSSRLLILGFSGTLTASSNEFKLKKDQIKEMKVRPHPLMAEILKTLSNDPNTTIIILSGSERALLDEVFSEFDLWLAAENGMFLRHTRREWMTTMPEHFNMEWVESVQLVFDYFCERTPRSFVEARETSLLWNYRYADVEFGRVQARDMLQHLWTGPISNSSVDVVQGSKSVEVRPVGLSKGAAIERIIGEIIHEKGIKTPIDFAMCCGHFLSKDEDIFTFFEPNLPLDDGGISHRGSLGGGSVEGRTGSSHKGHKNKELHMNKVKNAADRISRNSKGSATTGLLSSSPEAQSFNHERDFVTSSGSPIENGNLTATDTTPIMDLVTDHYFSCAVGRKVSQARYSLPSSEEVISALKTVSDRLRSPTSRNTATETS